MRVKTIRLRCKRCGHTWRPRGAIVVVCPTCKSAYFNIRRKGAANESQRGAAHVR